MQNSPKISCSSEVLAVLVVAAVVLASILAIAISPASAYAEGSPAAVSWGDNLATELGAGYKNTVEPRPVSVVGLTNIKSVALAYHFTVALLGDGTVRTWGGNAFGQLGDGTHRTSGVPTNVRLSGVTQIAASGAHALALLEDGTISNWGGNEFGELGNDALNPMTRTNKYGRTESTMQGSGSTTPVAVPNLHNVVAVSAGNGTEFALLADGTVLAWGRNNNSQLGTGRSGPQICKTEIGEVPCSTRPEPVLLPDREPLHGVKAISAGGEATYALLTDGKVMAWGSNGRGQLGNGSTTDSNVAVEVKNLTGVVTISGGQPFALALLSSGRIAGWGGNGSGQLGPRSGETCQTHPCVKTARLINGLEGVSSISAGYGFALALSHGKLYAIGDNEPWGQLGIGTFSSTTAPKPIEGLPPVSTMAAGEQHAVALLQSAPGPQPLFQAAPSAVGVSATWAVSAPVAGLRWRIWSADPRALGAWSPTVKLKHACSVSAPCAYEISPLAPIPYEVELLSYTSTGTLLMSRRAVATP
jgi:alpha-tubulin suppressor-like RCC1 family protein